MKRSSRKRALQFAVGAGAVLSGIAVATEVGKVRQLVHLTKTSVDVDDTPAIDGIYGSEYDREGVEPLVLVEAGDSLLSGRGSSSPENSAAVQVAVGLAHAKQRPVRLVHVARTAHRHIHLARQLDDARERLDGIRPDLVFVTMGAAEVTGGSIWRQAKTDYRDFVSSFTRMGAKVVWGTVPPIDAPVPVAKSHLASGIMRQKGAQWDENSMTLLSDIAREGYGVTPVSFQALMADYRDHPEYFADKDPDHPVPDPFHPGDLGQWVAAERVVPFLVEALDTPGDPHPEHGSFDSRGRPIQGRDMPTPPRRAGSGRGRSMSGTTSS